MKSLEIDRQLDAYDEAFRSFVRGFRLPRQWFARPDHFAIKCADELDYLETCADFAGEVKDDTMLELTESGRLLASAELVGKVSLGDYEFGWVEIMQPKPGKETAEGFVEHTEFYAYDFFLMEQALRRFGVDYKHQNNDGHEWFNVVIDDKGREIKFNNRPLVDVIAWEQEQGLLRPVKLGAGA